MKCRFLRHNPLLLKVVKDILPQFDLSVLPGIKRILKCSPVNSMSRIPIFMLISWRLRMYWSKMQRLLTFKVSLADKLS